MEVKVLRLVTGEDLIVNIKNMTMDMVTISKPHVVVMQPKPDGRGVNVGLMDYLPFAEGNEFDIDRDKIIVMYEPKKGLKDSYLETTSGLLMPTGKGALIGP